MGTACLFFNNNVYFFYHWIMETTGQINITAALLPMICVIFIIATGVVLLNSLFQKKLYRQKLLQEELINRHQEELLKSSIQIQEEERKRIASDLHDELGAVLSITRMHLFALEEKCKKSNIEFQPDLPVSYTHLDVYKRQISC